MALDFRSKISAYTITRGRRRPSPVYPTPHHRGGSNIHTPNSPAPHLNLSEIRVVDLSHHHSFRSHTLPSCVRSLFPPPIAFYKIHPSHFAGRDAVCDGGFHFPISHPRQSRIQSGRGTSSSTSEPFVFVGTASLVYSPCGYTAHRQHGHTGGHLLGISSTLPGWPSLPLARVRVLYGYQHVWDHSEVFFNPGICDIYTSLS